MLYKRDENESENPEKESTTIDDPLDTVFQENECRRILQAFDF